MGNDTGWVPRKVSLGMTCELRPKCCENLRNEPSSRAKVLGLERVWPMGRTEMLGWVLLLPHRQPHCLLGALA